MPDYTWVCHSCKEANTPGTGVCRACGFPSVATGAEIAKGVCGKTHRPRSSKKEFLRARREELAALPLWKKPFAYLLRALQFVAGVTFWVSVFGLSLPGMALGLAALVVAELLYQFLKGKPYVWEVS